MNSAAKMLVLFVILFHAAIFVVEVFFWMNPGVHGIALRRLGGPVGLDLQVQAAVLRATFVNLGFYNLFLAVAGIVGFGFLRRGQVSIGRTLILYMCLSAVGAGVVLLVSTQAYLGALLQATPAAIAIALVVRAVRGDKRPAAAVAG